MENTLKNYITEQFEKSLEVLNKLNGDKELQKCLEECGQRCVEALLEGGKILLAGNGGSAADAQHIAGELVSRFEFDRPGLAGIALTTDTSILTAVGNDYGYNDVFARQVQALGRKGDILIVYSTSGNSVNILSALKVARSMGVASIGLTGSGNGKMNEICDFVLAVPSTSTPRIQEGHALLGHTLCGLIENAIFGPKA